MIEQRKDNPQPYWICTKCNWAFAALQEANKHNCCNEIKNSFISYTRNKE
jgi:hypothetical protein